MIFKVLIPSVKLCIILPFLVGRLHELQDCLISNPRLHGDLLECSVQTPPMHCITNTFTRSFEVKDFDQIAEKILAQGGQIAMEKFAIPGQCWQGYFLDPDHNTFGLVQVDPNAH